MTASNLTNGSEKNFNSKEERKLRKPLIEKRRRERINSSLEQLKGIMVDAYNLDQSKLEKADVLEITVQHMEGLQKTHGPGCQGPSMAFESRHRYSSGYIQCMHEVHNLLLNCAGMDKSLGARLLNHLLKALPQMTGENSASGNTGNNTASKSPLPTSPSQSPLPLVSFAPRSLHLHTPPATPPSPSSPHCSPGLLLQREGGGSRYQEQPSPPRSCSPQPPAHAEALPPFFPGGNPSMWRPW
ncbi:hairy-related 8a isoform X2 [Electrophorus electricus]|uniref:hairy-related 8a isoform X2 n=1 Tax=Electrophorus electricus TaxID=8005 RepID=UPI000F0A6CFF|nr:hairy-related 8a isoform X2 [Electrophorus electricus]